MIKAKCMKSGREYCLWDSRWGAGENVKGEIPIKKIPNSKG
jgi:hypothetical protein